METVYDSSVLVGSKSRLKFIPGFCKVGSKSGLYTLFFQ